jgi:hypothetical protein
MKNFSVFLLLIYLAIASAHSEFLNGTWHDDEYGELHQVSSASPVIITDEVTGFQFELKADLVQSYLDFGLASTFGILATNIESAGASYCTGDVGYWDGTLPYDNTTNTTIIDDDPGVEEFNVTGNETEPSPLVWKAITIDGELYNNTNLAYDALEDALVVQEHVELLECDFIWSSQFSNLASERVQPGVHCFEEDDVWLCGDDLLLDGLGDPNAYWIFKVRGKLTFGSPATAVNIDIVNGGSPCNVYWFVDGKVRLHRYSQVFGTLVANGAIELLVYSRLIGSAISLNETVWLTEGATVDYSFCSTALREDFNTSFFIYGADECGLVDIANDSRVLTWEGEDPHLDVIAGFEIVCLQGVINNISITSPPLDELQLTWVNSAQRLEVWYLLPGHPKDPIWDEFQLCGDDNNQICYIEQRGCGTFYFVAFGITQFEPGSSSTGIDTGGETGETGGETGEESSTGRPPSTISSTGGRPRINSGSGGRPPIMTGDPSGRPASVTPSISAAPPVRVSSSFDSLILPFIFTALMSLFSSSGIAAVVYL